MKKKENNRIKNIVISIAIPILIGIISSLFMIGKNNYNDLNKPPLSPPSIIFPIVWTILYILMGISYYIVYYVRERKRDPAIKIYYIQLIINALWTIIFFEFNLYFFAFIWLLLLIIFVSTMIMLFLNINKEAAYLQIPYIIWIVFATYLNLGIYMLN